MVGNELAARDRGRNRYAVAALVAALATLCLISSGCNGRTVLHGAWIGKQFTGREAPWDWKAVRAFERRNMGGEHLDLVHWSSPFYSIRHCGGHCRFQRGAFRKVRDHHVTPFFSWADKRHGDARVASGVEDGYLRSWAKAAKSWGHPLLLRFAWEMNGSWFRWGVGNHGNTAGDYVAMWRHVHDIFTRVGATNVKWVWCPNVGGSLSLLTRLYPGRRYVNWTCLDGYNRDHPWKSFTELFGSTYDKILRIAPSKPMIIGEVASTESGGSKERWITNMFAALPRRFPRIYGIIWFDKYEHGDWPIETSAAASAAFADAVN